MSAAPPPALRVIEIFAPGPAGRAAGLAAKLFAGYGHDVVQLVTGEIDPDAPDRLWRDTGKRRVCLDWRETACQAQLTRLLAGADVLLDASGPDGLAAAGYDAPALRRAHPALVIVQLSPFGHTGPRAGYAAEQITLYAASGLMQATGDGDRAPLNAGVPVVSDSAGLKAYTAATMALFRRGRDGGGDAIDLSLAEAAMENIEIALAQWLNAGQLARRNGDEHAMVPWRTYDCADGEAVITSGPMRHWLTGARLFGAPELVGEQLVSMADRIARRDCVEALMQPWLARTPRREVFHAGQRAGLAWGYVATLAEALDCEQTRAREAIVERSTGGGRGYRLPHAPYRAGDCPWDTTAAPVRSETPEAIDWTPCPARPTGDDRSPAPLAGVRVLDFTHDWAGPHAARTLADYGAEVIKIEYPGRLDGMRGGYAARFDAHPRVWQLHRNKRSVTLDLHRDDHHACMRRLVASADVVLENSRPGVMARLGLDHAALVALRPDIITVSLSAFGATGPHAPYAGYGGTIEALSGLQSLTGYAENAPTRRVREMDVVNGMFGACAVMTALLHRQRTGRGQWVDVSERETCTWLAGAAIVAADLGREPRRRGNRDPGLAPQGVYACAGQDRWLALAIRHADDWRGLCALMDAPAWMQAPALEAVDARAAVHDDIDRAIADWTRSRDARALERRLQAQGVPAAMVQNARDLAADDHLAARGWFVTLPDARLPGLAFEFARGGGRVAHRGPAVGADNGLLTTLGGLDVLPGLEAETLGTAFDNGPHPAGALDQS